jgi:hypothetical protein
MVHTHREVDVERKVSNTYESLMLDQIKQVIVRKLCVCVYINMYVCMYDDDDDDEGILVCTLQL